MKKIFYLSTCDTCKRIIKQLNNISDFELQDIKVNNIGEDELNFVAEKSGSYEAVFSKRARKYKALGLKEKSLTENDFKSHILEEYTFLKRPVVIDGDNVFVGNSKKVIESLVSHFNQAK